MRDPARRDRLDALFTYLVDEEGMDLTLEDLNPISRDYSTFSVPQDDPTANYPAEYLVYTDSEADEACRDDTASRLNDMGLEGFSSYASQYIIDNFLTGSDRLWDEIKDWYVSYLEDIKSESGRIFETRQQDEIIDTLNEKGELPVDYDDLVAFVNGENSDPDCSEFLAEWDNNVEDYIDTCAEYYKDDWDDPIEYYRSNFGEDYVLRMIKNGDVDFDIDGVTEWRLDSDGRGGILSYYDGEEHEVEVRGTTYYIYRVD